MIPKKTNRGTLLGAAFLMATSAVGPGFLTQTTVFTQSMGASFGFVILASVVLDIGVQLNVWRIIAVAQKRAPEIANQVLPGLGMAIALLIVLGGLAFNIGNIGGAGLGFEVLLGIPTQWGAILAAGISMALFLVKEAGRLMDRFVQGMGLLMIGLIVYVAVTSAPPVGEALTKSLFPSTINVVAIVTLVGGTVGGYITFAGGHRLLDAGIHGQEALPQVTRSAISGIGLASLIRIFLFLAALGVVSKGLILDEANPPAAVFALAAGQTGYKLFGLVMVSAAITSVIGSAYTSVSFIKFFSPVIEKHENRVIIVFITLSTVVYVWVGRPVQLLILAGALNGLILPLTLGSMLIASRKKQIVGDYLHPVWLTIFGLLVVLILSWLGLHTLINQISLFNR